MGKTVLIISSDYTGQGHKSITESLCEKTEFHPNVKIHVVDGFSLGGPFLLNIGKLYGPLTRSSENLWKFLWKLSAIHPSYLNDFLEVLIRDNFQKLLDEVKPDMILSVHPNFNGSILNILEKQHLKIPFITLIADLVNIYPLWADLRADYIISPTFEARHRCLQYGIPDKKIKVLGFPVRSRFFKKNKIEKVHYKKEQPFTCLIMSGGEGVGNMKKIAETLLNHFDCSVKIVAGRNEKQRIKLENLLKSRYGEKVEIYGFIKNIQDLMLASDIIFTRGSPNAMFEAIATATPLIITGALPGQEEDNPAFVEKLNLGVVCKNPHDIKNTINTLLENNGEKLKIMKKCQQEFINSNAAEDIFRFIVESADPYYEEKILAQKRRLL
ncbi:MGDG synthase family glycosyltransferase [Bacillus salipaludis]|uniref:MGDG synthase family glycosyltransferase n=1 Tax=Bacillus salipaludis TaxID=2547811 RepID=UPI002E1A3D9D|nr:glycosyltransferase [Bacillus salipaludis]